MDVVQLMNFVPLVNAGIYLILILFLLFHQRQEKNPIYPLVAYLGSSIIWFLTTYLWFPNGIPPNLPLVFLLCTTILLFVTTARYIDRPLPARWYLVALLPIAIFVLDIIRWLPLFQSTIPLTFHLTIAGILGQIGWLTLGIITFLIALSTYRATNLPWHANRLLYWLIGIGTILVGTVMSNFAEPTIYILGHTFLMVGAVELTYGLVSHRIFDVRYRFRRISSLFFLGLLTTIPLFIVLTLTLTLNIGGTLPMQAAILLLVIAGTILITSPLRPIGVRFLNRFATGQRFDTRDVVRGYSQAIARVLDVEQLSLVIIGTLSELLQTSRGALILLSEQPNNAQLEPIPAIGHISRLPQTLSNDSLFLQTLTQQHQPLLQYELDFNRRFQALDTTERGWLNEQAMEVFIPISTDSDLDAFIALGPKISGLTYRPGELELMQLLADQTGVALQNARLYRELGTQNEQIRTLNDDLVRQNERLERMDEVKSDFITIASHELRTPLTQVKGYADILGMMTGNQQLDQSQTADIISRINDAVKRLETIISAMLDASQLEVNTMQLVFTRTSMQTLVRLAVEPLQPKLEARRMVLICNDLEALPPLHADFKRMVQTIQSLVNNALKYTPDAGTIHIEGTTVPSIEGNDYIELTISDTGIGIDPRNQEMIFEKFFRVDDPQLHSTGDSKFKGAGPGLGLPIARGVIEAHGGKIWVESEGEDEERLPGSTFHIVLPVMPPLALTQKEKKGAERPDWLIG